MCKRVLAEKQMSLFLLGSTPPVVDLNYTRKRTEAKAPVLLINLNYSAPLVCLARLPMFSKLLPEKFINEGLPLTPAYNFDSTNAS